MTRSIKFSLFSLVLLARQVVGLQGFATRTNRLLLSTKSKSPQIRLLSTADPDETPSFESQAPTNGTSLFENAVALDSITTSRNSNGALKLWKRRLITREDPFSIHKIAAVVYTISSVILLGSGTIRLSESAELFSVIPPELEGVMNVFTLSNIIMCAVSVRMALIHRQGDLTARNGFLGTAISSLFSGFFLVWISPFEEGNIFNTLWISRSCFAALVVLATYFIADSVLQTGKIVESRQERMAQDYQGRKLIDAFFYIFPLAFAAPLIIITGFITCVLHDRTWFLEQCQFIDQQMPYPGMQSHIFYQQLSTSLAAGYGALFVTLRDKKLISKQQEWGGIAIVAMPATIWSIYTTVIFVSYLFEPH
eukprot:CAMPEP_0195294202 /NCGR_PEP_ID=MMETSP0707-20130614/14325_1 /TAXON_ID=33640 /ORGANISM="Asterionellopsis glacialis, Strain CCMP134" /LENGTH=365 /DNA_ID=CAMNT_0040355103 /DNA_START=33 /DNA_END=1130 /DNA_ORIENTATION=+